MIALGLAAPIAIHRRLLYGSENGLWDLVASELGPAWAEAQASALGLADDDADESARAALRLLGLAADEVARSSTKGSAPCSTGCDWPQSSP